MRSVRQLLDAITKELLEVAFLCDPSQGVIHRTTLELSSETVAGQ
jgi:hypothetical protein